MQQKIFWKKYILLTVLVFGLFFLDILIGSVKIPFSEIFSGLLGKPGIYSEIIWQFRLPKAITCVLAGGALATSGLMMQTLFRNPLAGCWFSVAPGVWQLVPVSVAVLSFFW